MPGSLKPCGNCSRHVRIHERACPFCGEQLALSEPVAELRLLSRLDRNTMVALGAVLSAAGIVLGCREAAPVAIYGAPAPEQVQPAPSAAPPPEAPTPPDTTVLVPEPSASPSAAPSPVSSAPPPASAPTHAVKPPKPPASAQPHAPAAAYGAPPSMGPPGGMAPMTPMKPDTKK